MQTADGPGLPVSWGLKDDAMSSLLNGGDVPCLHEARGYELQLIMGLLMAAVPAISSEQPKLIAALACPCSCTRGCRNFIQTTSSFTSLCLGASALWARAMGQGTRAARGTAWQAAAAEMTPSLAQCASLSSRTLRSRAIRSCGTWTGTRATCQTGHGAFTT